MSNSKNIQFFLIAIIIIFSCIQLFLTKPYHTDKTVVPAQIIKSMFQHRSIIGHNIPCYTPDKKQTLLYPTWAEEPPVYHILGTIFFFFHAENYLYKTYSLICFLLFIIGLYKLITLIVPTEHNYNKIILLLLICFQPYIYIHAHRPLPDNLAIVFLIFTIFFYIQERYGISILLATLAVTTKALAIFPIFFLCVGNMLYDNKPFRKKVIINLLHGLAVIPFFMWLYYLQYHHIYNPFFEHTVGIHHTGGNNYSILLSKNYWSKLFSWIVIRGVNPIIFLTGIFYLAISYKKQSKLNRYFQILFIGHIIYILIIRGPQRTAPWYSFYFLFIYLTLSWNIIYNWNIKYKILTIITLIIYSMGFISLTFNIKHNIQIPIPLNANIACSKLIMKQHTSISHFRQHNKVFIKRHSN